MRSWGGSLWREKLKGVEYFNAAIGMSPEFLVELTGATEKELDMECSVKGMIPGFLLVALLAAGPGNVASAVSVPTLKVSIHSGQKSIKNGAAFPVTTKIQNVGREAPILHIWLCSYDAHWITDSPFAHVESFPCTKNFLQEVRLKPGEAYKRDWDIRIAVSAEELQQESVRFRLGFTDGGNEGGNNVLPAPVWSNSITVKITEKATLSNTKE